jgi:hypothetical protein
MVPYVGSQWWALSRECGQYIVKYVRENPQVVRFFRHSHVPDESFIQTVVMNSPFRDSVANTGLRYVEWDGGFNPRVLEKSDLGAIQASGCPFARKLVLGAVKELSGRTVSSETLMLALDEIRALEEGSPSGVRFKNEINFTPKMPVMVKANGI